MAERYSHQRQLVWRIVKENRIHPSADEVYALARKEDRNISLGTVYRNLKYLSEKGLIVPLETGGKCLRYDGQTDGHSHFVCLRCGQIRDLTAPENLQNNELSGCGCTVDYKITVYYGTCDKCNKK